MLAAAAPQNGQKCDRILYLLLKLLENTVKLNNNIVVSAVAFLTCMFHFDKNKARKNLKIPLKLSEDQVMGSKRLQAAEVLQCKRANEQSDLL